MYRNEVTRTVYSALTKIQGANSKQARENSHRTYVILNKNLYVIKTNKMNPTWNKLKINRNFGKKRVRLSRQGCYL